MWTETRGAVLTADEELEEAGTALLKATGWFMRGTGIRSPRSEGEARAREWRNTDWLDDQAAGAGSINLWDELDVVAQAAGLCPEEKAILGMARVEEYSLREMGRMLGLTVYRVRLHLLQALEKCARVGLEGDLPASPGALFREEIRQKKASIYRRPHRGSRR